jgi:alpha/beta superfamily hydrolase
MVYRYQRLGTTKNKVITELIQNFTNSYYKVSDNEWREVGGSSYFQSCYIILF